MAVMLCSMFRCGLRCMSVSIHSKLTDPLRCACSSWNKIKHCIWCTIFINVTLYENIGISALKDTKIDQRIYFCVSYHFGQLTIKYIRFCIHRSFQQNDACYSERLKDTCRRNVFPGAPSCVAEMSHRQRRLLAVVPILFQMKLAANFWHQCYFSIIEIIVVLNSYLIDFS